ncbi:MAG: hypothetical protein Q4D50_08370 [Eubacteriales bacterium]|nr:hypothetical protein [Eubacteriales bacterium]
MENNESFEYTYSAPEHEEIKRIREKYLPKDEREQKLEALRRLDQSVTQKATWASVTLGTASTLVMGVGMCCCLVWTQLFALGIVIGVIGILGIALAYPMYRHIAEKERARVAPEILRLTQELM